MTDSAPNPFSYVVPNADLVREAFGRYRTRIRAVKLKTAWISLSEAINKKCGDTYKPGTLEHKSYKPNQIWRRDFAMAFAEVVETPFEKLFREQGAPAPPKNPQLNGYDGISRLTPSSGQAVMDFLSKGPWLEVILTEGEPVRYSIGRFNILDGEWRFSGMSWDARGNKLKEWRGDTLVLAGDKLYYSYHQAEARVGFGMIEVSRLFEPDLEISMGLFLDVLDHSTPSKKGRKCAFMAKVHFTKMFSLSKVVEVAGFKREKLHEMEKWKSPDDFQPLITDLLRLKPAWPLGEEIPKNLVFPNDWRRRTSKSTRANPE